MPMIWHHAPGEDPHRHSLLYFGEHTLKRQVVAVVMEDAAFTVCAVEDVIHEPSRRSAQRPCHGPLTLEPFFPWTQESDPFFNKRVLTPFSGSVRADRSGTPCSAPRTAPSRGLSALPVLQW